MPIRIGRLTAAELKVFQAGLPAWNSTEYAKRLAAQERGELVQVVAWMDERPVGKAMLLFPGHDEFSESSEREGCGEIRDVGVAEAARRRGVATSLIGMLEAAAREHGMERIGLTVASGEEDAPARSLYEKLGYEVAHGPFIASTDLYDDDGRPIHVGDVMSYLTKSLLPN
ncbi:MAG: GNAT family N-acetyltransferase [Actinomycetota bacterium]